MADQTNQTGASAKRDIVGRDKTEVHILTSGTSPTTVEQLLVKLDEEIKKNVQVRDTLEDLKRYHRRRSGDDINGLEAKLNKGGRSHEYQDAIEKKELFAKALDRWSLSRVNDRIFSSLS